MAVTLRGLWAASALLLGACASVPQEARLPSDAEEWIAPAIPAACEIPSEQSLLTAAVGDDEAAQAYVREVSRAETYITREPLIAGNRVDLLVDGPATHDAQLAAIAAAKHHVHLQVYILTDDDLGQRYAKALIARAQQGVEVRVMVDGVGGIGAGLEYRKRLEAAGVQFAEFNTLNPTKDLRVWRLNRRNHRKMLVVDGHTAFTGGINIMDEYTEAPSLAGSSPKMPSAKDNGWRDTHIRLKGPAVAQFQRSFIRDWETLNGKLPSGGEYYPPLRSEGDDLVRAVTNRGTDLLQVALGIPRDIAKNLLNKREYRHQIYQIYFSAIRKATQRVWITQAYFAPSEDFIDLLKETAQRGVDVRLMMPGTSDVGLLPLAAQHEYDELLRAGVKLFEYQPAMLHAKTAVVDGLWSTVGSSNMDYRSFLHNDEANAIIIGRHFAGEMEALFQKDLAQAHQITLDDWKQRGIGQRLKEKTAWLFKFWI